VTFHTIIDLYESFGVLMYFGSVKIQRSVSIHSKVQRKKQPKQKTGKKSHN